MTMGTVPQLSTNSKYYLPLPIQLPLAQELQESRRRSRLLHGVPNGASSSFAVDPPPEIGTWNGRGIFVRAPSSIERSKKVGHLSGLMGACALLAVQEVHAKHADILSFSSKFKSTHWMHYSVCSSSDIYCCDAAEHILNNNLVFDFDADSLGSADCSENSSASSSEDSLCDSFSSNSSSKSILSKSSGASKGICRSKGGVLTTIQRSAFSKQATCSSVVYVPGRCIETIIVDKNCTTYVINIHFFGWTHAQTALVSDRLLVLYALAACDPLTHRVFVLGDFNIRFEEKPILDVGNMATTQKPPKHSKMAKTLLRGLRDFTRIEHDSFSHFNCALGHLNDIDHIFLSPPGWCQVEWRFSVEVQKPEDLFARGISDHGAIICSFKSSHCPSTEQPIPTWVAKLPIFKVFLDNLVKASRLEDLLLENSLVT